MAFPCEIFQVNILLLSEDLNTGLMLFVCTSVIYFSPSPRQKLGEIWLCTWTVSNWKERRQTKDDCYRSFSTAILRHVLSLKTLEPTTHTVKNNIAPFGPH